MKNIGIILIVLFGLGMNASGQGYVVNSLVFDIQGRTSEYQLFQRAEMETGSQFPDRTALDAYLADRIQLLLNERVLESVEIEVLEGTARPDGLIPVDLVIHTKDTWNIIALPYFRYDSNLGLLLSVRARDYNFLGSMEALRINFNRDQDLNENASWGMDADFKYPFPALGLDWNWTLGGAFSIPETGDVGAASLDTSLGFSIPAGIGALEFTAAQAVWFNRRDSTGTLYDDPVYTRSSLEAAWSVPLSLDFFRYPVIVRPRLSLANNWLPGGLVDPDLDTGPVATTGFGLSTGRTDWKGNFRNGYRFSLDAAYNQALIQGDSSRVVSMEAALFGATGWIGPSARLLAVWTPDGLTSEIGSALRGILNSRAETDIGIALNLDVPIRMIRFMPYEWFGKGWMKLFQFEQHWSPFLDLGLGNYDGTFLDYSKGWYGAGLEVITYPLAMRSFYIRISAGWSLPDVLALRSISGTSERDGRDIREFFIGFGTHY